MKKGNIAKKETTINRNDVLLAIALFLLAGALAVIFFLGENRPGNLVSVTVDKVVYGTYALDENQAIEIDTDFGHNVLHIENGSVRMTEANCPDGYCKKQGEISTEKETIVCLPHKLVVEITTTEENKEKDYDLLVK